MIRGRSSACRNRWPRQRRDVTTYVDEAEGNPTAIVVPRGEQFQNLNAQEYRYAVLSRADSPQGRPEAVLEMAFKSRLIPMFQFAAFYNKDLEILPGPAMMLEGPVHTNGDLYVGSGDRLDILGQVTTAGEIYNGRKNTDTCMGGVSVIDPVTLAGLPACSGGTTSMNQTALDAWNGMIDTTALNGCSVVSHSDTMYNNREGTTIEMMDVDLQGLLNCLNSTTLLGPGKDLADTSQGGLVFYMGVDGPDSATINNYGVRVRNGAELASTQVGAPEVEGLTVVSDQAMYVEGSYNATSKKPASFLCDSLNILSNNWNDADSTLALANREAGDTDFNNAENLPPLSPRFVSLKQELFSRLFEL